MATLKWINNELIGIYDPSRFEAEWSESLDFCTSGYTATPQRLAVAITRFPYLMEWNATHVRRSTQKFVCTVCIPLYIGKVFEKKYISYMAWGSFRWIGWATRPTRPHVLGLQTLEAFDWHMLHKGEHPWRRGFVEASWEISIWSHLRAFVCI